MKKLIGSIIVAFCVALAGPAFAGGHLASEKGHGKDDHKGHDMDGPPKASTKLNALALNVDSIPRSEKYYVAVFGMKRVFQYPPEGTPIEIGLASKDQPSAMLLLAHFNDDPLPEGKGRYGRIVINTDDAWTLAKRAEKQGSKVRQVGGDEGPLLLFFNDPDGYEIELYQAR